MTIRHKPVRGNNLALLKIRQATVLRLIWLRERSTSGSLYVEAVLCLALGQPLDGGH